MDHYRVWPLVATVLFPCFGAILVGFDFGATQWLMIAIASCSSAEQAAWCTDVEGRWEIAGILETTCSITAMFACIIMYFVGSKVGGRTELLIASWCFTIGSTTEAESGEITRGYTGLAVLFVGRAIYGLGIGLTMHSIPTVNGILRTFLDVKQNNHHRMTLYHFHVSLSQFIAENSPPKLRGALTGFIEVRFPSGPLLFFVF